MNLNSMADEKESIFEEILTEERLDQMRASGMEKPEEITWSRWLDIHKLSLKHSPIVYLSGTGLKNSEISNETGVSVARIGALLGNPKIQFEIKELQKRLFGEDPRKRFASIVNQAIDTIEEVMNDPEEKGSTRLQAATLVKETHLGKPTQTVDLGTNLIRSLFERLDQRGLESRMIDVTPPISLPPKLLTTQEISEDKTQEGSPTISEVDAWITTENY